MASTITGDHESRITDYTTVVCIQGNCIDRNAQQNGFGINGDVSFTLNAVDRHGVAYVMAHGQANAESCKDCSPTLNCNHEQPIVFDKEVYNSGSNATGGHYISEGGPAPSLRTEHPPGVCIRYIVRRLTPTECCRLQGFPDGWDSIDVKDMMPAEEDLFWLKNRQTFDAINGRPIKDYTPKQILDWYNKLHSDGAKYKMWGNGIALPNALYVMEGIAEAMSHAEL